MTRNPVLPPELRPGDFLGSMSDADYMISEQDINYSNCFFGFVDILGYSDLVSKLGDEAPREVFRIIRDAYLFHRSSYESVVVKILSDSILVWSTTEHPIAFWNVVNVIDLLGQSFLKKGIFLRGGVTYGKSFIHKDIIVSPALIESYKLEQAAVYPRFLIDKVALQRGMMGISRLENGRSGIFHAGFFRVCDVERIETDFDGRLILSPIHINDGIYSLLYGMPSSHLPGDAPLSSEQIEAVKLSGIQSLNELRSGIILARNEYANSRIKEKFNYFAGKFNSLLTRVGKEQEIGMIPLFEV